VCGPAVPCSLQGSTITMGPPSKFSSLWRRPVKYLNLAPSLSLFAKLYVLVHAVTTFVFTDSYAAITRQHDNFMNVVDVFYSIKCNVCYSVPVFYG